MTVIIRGLICLALIYGVYTETGLWTSLFCLLVLINTEFYNYMFSIIFNTILVVPSNKISVDKNEKI